MTLMKIKFGSLFAYTPRGDLPEHHKSRTLMRNLKNDAVASSGMPMSSVIALDIKKGLANYPFSDYFNNSNILIPIPKSSKLPRNGLWVPQRLTAALEREGLGISKECLIRKISLPRSSTALATDRPKAHQHYKSMEAKPLIDANDIVLVDDIITRGATVSGAADKIKDAFPHARIRVFAAIRTISDPAKFSNFVDPCTGTIELSGVDTFRTP